MQQTIGILENPGLAAEVLALATQLNLPVTAGAADTLGWHLSLQPCGDNWRLQLQPNRADSPGPLFVDFAEGRSRHRRLFGGGRNQPLARACGLKPGHNPDILDVTGGLGRDAFVLASLGCRVTLVERSAILHALLADGLRRAHADPDCAEIASRMTLVHANSIDYLQSLVNECPETVYLDPMYPSRKKQALVKKEMQYLQELLHAEADDGAGLLTAALDRAGKRVVVKRPKGAETLGGRTPAFNISSKNTRYDIYPC